MDLEKLRQYLMTKKGATEELPFGPDALVYKVLGKMFALVAWESSPLRLNLKCNPEHALALRTIYPSIIPGYHMNKDHWNTIIIDGSLSEDFIKEMIDDSYRLVVSSLSKTNQLRLGAL